MSNKFKLTNTKAKRFRRGDSYEESDDGSSCMGTLDTFIPIPKDFEGVNHPFRDAREKV